MTNQNLVNLTHLKAVYPAIELDSRTQAFALFIEGSLTGKIKHSVNCLKQAVALYEQLEMMWEVALSRVLLAYRRRLEGRIEEAKTLFEQSVVDWQRLDDPNQLAQTKGWYSTLLMYYGQREKALEIAFENLAYFESLGESIEMADALGRVATWLQWFGRYKESRALLLQSLKLQQKYGRSDWIAYEQIRLGLAEGSLGNFEKAYQVTYTGLEQFNKLRSVETSGSGLLVWGETYGFALSALGRILLALGREDEATKLLEEGVYIKRGLNAEEFQGWQLAYLGMCYISTNRYREAYTTIRDGLEMGVRLHDTAAVYHCICALLLGWASESSHDLPISRGIDLHRLAKLYGMVVQFPPVRDCAIMQKICGDRIMQSLADLPEVTFEAARVRGREMDVWQTAEALLQELAEQEDQFSGTDC